MAHALLERAARRRGIDGLTVRSAGTLGIRDAPASPEAIQALGEIDVDLTGHRSRALDDELLARADLVLVMDRGHERAVHAKSSAASARTHRLLAFERSSTPASPGAELEDPVGRPVALFRRQRARMLSCVEHVLDHLAERRPPAR